MQTQTESEKLLATIALTNKEINHKSELAHVRKSFDPVVRELQQLKQLASTNEKEESILKSQIGDLRTTNSELHLKLRNFEATRPKHNVPLAELNQVLSINNSLRAQLSELSNTVESQAENIANKEARIKFLESKRQIPNVEMNDDDNNGTARGLRGKKQYW